MKKILIICKKSIKKQWLDEINKFTDLNTDFTMIRTESTPKKRKQAYDEFNKASKAILVTNYHSFLNDTAEFSNMTIDFVIIDEVHSVKARNGRLNNNISQITYGKPTVFLTGTPIMSRPEDIFGIIQMVDPKYFGKWTAFSNRYIQMANGAFGWQAVGVKNIDELREKTQDILIRRTEYEVSIQLPKTVCNKINCAMDNVQEAIICKIQEQQMEYQQALENLKENGVIPDYNQDKAERIEASSKALIAATQAAATDPRMFNMSNSKIMREAYGTMVPKSYKMSDKIESILDIVEDILQSGNKVILFSKFKTSAILIANDIQSNLKEKALLYTGAEDEASRDKAVDLFKNTMTYNILIGTEAMAEGLNLQCAKFIINIDQPDTLAIKTQRIGRARRAGSQFDNVIIYDMITNSTAKANSKDEERLSNIEKNQNLTDALVNIDEAQRIALINAMKA